MCAYIFESLGASLALRGLRAADVSAEIDESVAGLGLCLARYGIGKYPLDPDGIFKLLRIKSESSADADAMGIRNDSGDAENIAQQKIGYLSADAGECAELINILRELTSVFITQFYTRRLYRGGLCSVQSAGADYAFDIRKLAVGKRRQSRVLFEKLAANDVDASIGTLCRKSAHNEQFPCVFPSPLQRACGSGIKFIQFCGNKFAARSIGRVSFFHFFVLRQISVSHRV